MKLRILLTCEDYLPSVGGAEICVANLKLECERLGHVVTVFTNTVDAHENLTIVRLPWCFAPRALMRHVRALWRLLGEHDIVHCQYSFRLAAICAVIARMRGKPMLITQQGKGIVPEVHPKWHHAFLVKLCQNVSMRGATIVTSTSDEIADLTAAFIPRSKIILITNGYDARQFITDPGLPVPSELSVHAGKTKILTVRRLVPKNGIHILIQALALVRDCNPNFHYFAVGDGRARELIETLVKNHSLRDHVTLLGARSNAAIKPLYQHADLVIVPSSAEATSIACIEAMGMGKPLIASRVGGLIDLLGRESTYGLLVDVYGNESCNYDAPLTVPPDRLQALANAILAFMRDSAPFHERARKAQQHARTMYTWEAITRQYLSLYERVLPRSS